MKNLFDLTGKNAIVVGGAGGLGKLVAQAFAEAGANVCIASRTEEKLKAACEELKELTGKEFKYYVMDAGKEEMVEAVAKQANEDYGHIDILVNSQGVNKKFPALDFPMDIFDSVMHDDVASILMTSKHFGKYMKENGYGKIVNVTSVRGKIATKGPGNAAYCAAKGAVDMLTKQLASEFGPFGITVNAFGPNIMKTPMMTKVFEMRAAEAGITVDEYLERQGAGLPMRRLSDPEDCVGTALFLAAPASDFMTGNILYPDGGLTAIG
ncbi:MAG: SDR family oxidoreductase [Oscillospiraceae bacterium]|nr:SDR family oxidoreductase [Oscillospiraceae bacterium]